MIPLRFASCDRYSVIRFVFDLFLSGLEQGNVALTVQTR